jgi:AcrR family transcriptional regulator
LRYQDVSTQSGVAVASLRHYFPTLAGLRKDALRHLVRLELQQLEQEVLSVDDPREQIRLFFSNSLSVAAGDRRNGWRLWVEYWLAGAHDPELAKDHDEVDLQWRNLAQRCIDAGVEQGYFTLDQSSFDAAWELHSLLDGFGIRLAHEHTVAEAEQAVAGVERGVRRLLHLDA